MSKTGENETFDEVLRCIQNDIVHFVGKSVKHSRDLLQEYHDRFKAAHRREMEVLRRRLDAVVESRTTTCGLCPSCGKIKELERKVGEANLKYLAEKARRTDTYKDERIKAQDEEIAALKGTVTELRECLKQAYGDKIGTYTMKGNEVARWSKALEVDRS